MEQADVLSLIAHKSRCRVLLYSGGSCLPTAMPLKTETDVPCRRRDQHLATLLSTSIVPNLEENDKLVDVDF